VSIHVTPIPRLTVLTTPAFTLGTTNSAGSAVTAVASNSTLLAFDATVPGAAYAASAATGSAVVASRRDHTHSIPTTLAPFQLVGSNTTEGSEDSTTASDILTVSSLTIPVGNPVLVVCAWSRPTGGSASIPRIGVKINSTVVSEDQALTSSSSGPVSGLLTIWIGPRIANYLRTLWYEAIANFDGGTVVKNLFVNEAAALPAAVITSISIRGSVSATPSELFADQMAVYQLPI
jgi:hypothetical protein